MKKLLISLLTITLLFIGIFFGIEIYVKESTKERINTKKIDNIDCILVLGAGIRNNKPSPMLTDRLNKAIELYNQKISDKIIVSGDHGRTDYDEVNVMKKYLIDAGIPSENIFMDHAGFSTYDSLYRARDIFEAKKIIIVTQEYHMYRSLYIAKKLNIDAYGAPAKKISYAGDTYRELREKIARVKDVIKCVIKPKPKYLGKAIPVTGNGDETND